MTATKNVLTIGLLTMLSVSAVQGATFTWNGGGASDAWSDVNNWGGVAPPNDGSANLVFDGATRLTPDQNIGDTFNFNTLTFESTAGAFVLDGTVDIDPPNNSFGHNRLEFDGTNPTITMNSANDVRIRGTVIAQSGTNTINVTGAGSLQIPWITGSTGETIVKEGSGKLILYEDADGQNYASSASNVGPRLHVNEGTVEVGTRSDRFVQSGTNWVADTTQKKTNYALLIGDGLGAEKSAVVKLVDGGTPIGSGLEIKNDGWFDLNGMVDYDSTANFTTLDHAGVISTGSSSLLIRDGITVNMIGNALIEGTASDSVWMYDGSTFNVDTTETRARITADIRIISSADGPTFDVSNKPSDTVDLEITGILGTVSPGGALNKNGAGTMLVNDYNYTTGTQTINAGTLLVNGTANGSTGTWEVKSGGTLGGTGSITDLVTVRSGGSLAPGMSAGELTIEDLVLESGAILDFELGDPNGTGTWDTLVVTNNLTLDGTLNISDLLDFGAGTYEIITVGGTLTDLGLTLGTLPTGFTGEISIIGGNTVQLEVTAASFVPEPSSAFLLLVGGSFLSLWTRKNRKRGNLSD